MIFQFIARGLSRTGSSTTFHNTFRGLRPANLKHLIAALLLAVGGPAAANTFTATFSGTVADITADPEFSAAAPFTLGDTFSVTAVFLETPIATASLLNQTRHIGTMVSMSGSVGGYSFDHPSTGTFVNDTRVRGRPYPGYVGDLITSNHAAAGDDIAHWSPLSWSYSIFDANATVLDDDSYGAHLFDAALRDALPNPPFGSAVMRLAFSSSQPGAGPVLVTANLLADPQPAPIPLPASVWLLLAGLVPLIRMGRAHA